MTDTGRSARNLSQLAAAYGEWTSARSTPEAIRSATFPTVRKGFDPKEVTAYLERLAIDVERLQNRVGQLEAEKADAGASPTASDMRAAPDRDAFNDHAAHIAELMRRFDEDVRMMRVEAEAEVNGALVAARTEADEIRREARLEREEAVADAASVVARAQADAQRVQQDAQLRADELDAEAQRALREARSHADEVLRSIAASRQTIVDDVRRMRDELVMTLARVDAVLAEREDADRLIVVDETRSDARTS
jgi:DivIVA domain-containing protein